MESKTHWEDVYSRKRSDEVSWFQAHAEASLELIRRTGVKKSGHIIDVGGGASTLVDDLLDRNFEQISVLDISEAALQVARNRLGKRANKVDWIADDITTVELPNQLYDVWHDRAVFHFLTSAEDRMRYIEVVNHSVKVGGHVIVATFGLDGPLECSGLDVVRYSPDSLHKEFGNKYTLIESLAEVHQTPSGTEQKFNYCHFRKS